MPPFPSPTTALIGRQRELAAVVALVVGGARLVSVTGLGGIGKTRLALEVCRVLDDRGVAYCNVAACADIDDVLAATAVALEVDLSGAEPFDVLVAATRKRAAHVVVLDGLEALASSVGPTIERWLRSSPPTTVLITTRRCLGSASEHIIALDALPSGHTDSPATALLLTRARALQADWGAGDEARVARLAERLDGLPLAIELVAAHARNASVAELEARWGARVGRSEAMRAAVEWSWTELGPESAADLTRLAVIEGSFDIELAAAAIGRHEVDAFECLDRLARDSLVSVSDEGGAVAYRVLDTVRAFVIEVGDAGVADRARQAVTATVLGRAQAALTAVDGAAARAVLTRDRGRLDALVARAVGSPDVEVLATAYAAAATQLDAFRRRLVVAAPVSLAARLCAATLATGGGVPLAERCALALLIARYPWAVSSEDWHVFMVTAERWLREAGDVEQWRELQLYIAQRLAVEWRLRGLLAVIDACRARPEARSAAIDYREVLLWVLARRGLGVCDVTTYPGHDERELERIALRLEAAQHITAGAARTNIAFLAVQLARPDGLARAQAAVRLAERTNSARGRSFALRELGRAELDRGEARAALELFGECTSTLEPGDFLRVETELEAVATLIEVARVEDARARLGGLEDTLNSNYTRAYFGALTCALGALSGERVTRPSDRTDSVEDAGFAVLAALDAPELEALCDDAVAPARFSTRVRQALRIGQAVLAARAGRALVVTLDGAAFRREGPWRSVESKPLLKALLGALVQGAMADPERRLDKEALGAALWPGERLPSELRDNRLHVAVSGLRKLGLGDGLVNDGRGFRLDPKVPLVRASARVWPDPPTTVSKRRGQAS